MIFEIISLLFGIIKILIYKILYFNRIIFKSIPKVNSSVKLAIKKGSKLSLGKNFRTRNNVSFRIYDKGMVEIGNDSFFNDNCSINCQSNIKIGDNCIFGQNVMIFDHDHDYKNDINKFVKKNVVIGNNVWIGANVIILKGVTIGDNCVISAGSVVRNNIELNTLFYQKRTDRSKLYEK